jgi:hypothetical protein
VLLLLLAEDVSRVSPPICPVGTAAGLLYEIYDTIGFSVYELEIPSTFYSSPVPSRLPINQLSLSRRESEVDLPTQQNRHSE